MQKLLVAIEDRRGRSVDNQIGLDSVEDLHHRLDRGNIAIVVSRTGQTVVRRAQVNHRYGGLVLGVARAQGWVLEAAIALGLGQCAAGIRLRGEVQQMIDNVPSQEAAATDDQDVPQFQITPLRRHCDGIASWWTN